MGPAIASNDGEYTRKLQEGQEGQGTDWNGTKLSPAFGEFPLKSAI